MHTKDSPKNTLAHKETSRKTHKPQQQGEKRERASVAEDIEYEDSLQQPAWHVVVLSVFSMGLYMPYWFYQTGSKLEKEAEKLQNQGSHVSTQDLPPQGASNRLAAAGTLESLKAMSNLNLLFFTFLFTLPLVNLIVLQRFTCRYAGLIPNQESWVRKNPALSGFLVACVFGASALLGKLPGNWYLLYLSACLPLAVVQSWLNQHWALYENEKSLPRQAFSPLELLLIVAGAMVLGLILISAEINK